MKKTTVMIVDDESSIRFLLKEELKYEGFCVIEAPCGEDALKMIKANGRDISLVITDIQMPKMNGLVLSRKIKTCCPYIKIIFMSARPLREVHSLFSCQGEIHESNFIEKPFGNKVLLNKVTEFVT